MKMETPKAKRIQIYSYSSHTYPLTNKVNMPTYNDSSKEIYIQDKQMSNKLVQHENMTLKNIYIYVMPVYTYPYKTWGEKVFVSPVTAQVNCSKSYYTCGSTDNNDT